MIMSRSFRTMKLLDSNSKMTHSFISTISMEDGMTLKENISIKMLSIVNPYFSHLPNNKKIKKKKMFKSKTKT